MAHFDLDPYGNPRYAPTTTRNLPDPETRERCQKVERSLVSFAACYPSWKPPDHSVARFLDSLDPAVGAAAATSGGGVSTRGLGSLDASAFVPGAAIGGAWALMHDTNELGPPMHAITQKVQRPVRNSHIGPLGSEQGGAATDIDLRPGDVGLDRAISGISGISVPRNSSLRGWGDLAGSGAQEISFGSPESETQSVELQRVGLPPPKPKARTGAVPGGFKRAPEGVQHTQHGSKHGAQLGAQHAQHAERSDHPEPNSRRVTYGWVEATELKDVQSNSAPKTDALGRSSTPEVLGAPSGSMHASYASRGSSHDCNGASCRSTREEYAAGMNSYMISPPPTAFEAC